jgi:DNA-directed RNA polymerase subunit alpha
VNQIELSVRAADYLNNANVTTVAELTMKGKTEMLKYRNFEKNHSQRLRPSLRNSIYLSA